MLTYTHIEGDLTPEIVSALGLEEKMGGVRVRPLPVPAEVLFREPFVLSLSSGSDAIDVYLLDAPWVKSYSSTLWLASIEGEEALNALAAVRPELLDVNSVGEAGERQVLAVPFETKGNILFYRKDLLEAAGFEVPNTWAELTLQCRQILASVDDPNLEYGFVFHGMRFINDFYPIAWGFGGGLVDDEGGLTINRPENVRALAMVKRMLGDIAPSARQMLVEGLFDDYTAVERLFAQGRTIFMINWNVRWRDLEEGMQGQVIDIEQVGVAPIPCDAGQRSYSNIGSFGWGINYFSSRRQEASRFIQLITSYEAQRWLAINHGIIPARSDVLSDPQVRSRAPSVLQIAQVFENVVLRARPYQREIGEIMDTVLSDALLQDLDPLQALDYAQEAVSEELSKLQRDAGR